MSVHFLVLVFALALSAPTNQAVSPLAVQADTCELRVGADRIPGQVVRADALSFCVPTNWRQGGARTWQGVGVIRWELGTSSPAAHTGRRTIRNLAPDDVRRTSWNENVGGETVDFSESRAEPGRWLLRASWDQWLVFSGEAPSSEARALHLAIFRSVRRAPP